MRESCRIGKVTFKKSNVIPLNTITTAELPAAKVLAGAMEFGLKRAVVLGIKQDGEIYIASTHANLADAVFLLRMAESRMVEMGIENA